MVLCCFKPQEELHHASLLLKPALACMYNVSQACIWIRISLYPAVLFTIDAMIGRQMEHTRQRCF